ncbi:MAG: hypothetical protein JRN62_02785 [Nitrososphaerota archaeon]|jgi:hypothetical protein|nr:hypothetical protein [Nitrososphaerota archaeon]MDG6948923.1 hypothetical protein [Nitrososphaerota archaeon]
MVYVLYCQIHPLATMALRGGNTYFCTTCFPMKCQKCGMEMLTWAGIHERRHDTGITAIEGILDSNLYCSGDPKGHPFYCINHDRLHGHRCDHDYSVVECAFHAPCPRCGDTLYNSANLRSWLYDW